jgi:hypothetical protein
MSRIAAILQLLEDEDDRMQAELGLQLRSDPHLLAQVWAAAAPESAPQGLTRIVLAADAAGLIADFRAADTDVAHGAWLLTSLEQPRSDPPLRGPRLLDAMAAAVPRGADAGAVAEHLCVDLAFSGDRTDYHHPDNSQLDRVLERRCGLPLSLTVLWMLLCRRLDLVAEALTLPGHVVGCWDGGYIDLFEGGRSVDVAEIDRMCLAGGFVDPARFLVPASDRSLLQRMARNLVYAYAKRGDDQRSALATSMAR